MTTIGRPFQENNEQVKFELSTLIMLEKVFVSNRDNNQVISPLKAFNRCYYRIVL